MFLRPPAFLQRQSSERSAHSSHTNPFYDDEDEPLPALHAASPSLDRTVQAPHSGVVDAADAQGVAIGSSPRQLLAYYRSKAEYNTQPTTAVTNKAQSIAGPDHRRLAAHSLSPPPPLVQATRASMNPQSDLYYYEPLLTPQLRPRGQHAVVATPEIPPRVRLEGRASILRTEGCFDDADVVALESTTQRQLMLQMQEEAMGLVDKASGAVLETLLSIEEDDDVPARVRFCVKEVLGTVTDALTHVALQHLHALQRQQHLRDTKHATSREDTQTLRELLEDTRRELKELRQTLDKERSTEGKESHRSHLVIGDSDVVEEKDGTIAEVPTSSTFTSQVQGSHTVEDSLLFARRVLASAGLSAASQPPPSLPSSWRRGVNESSTRAHHPGESAGTGTRRSSITVVGANNSVIDRYALQSPASHKGSITSSITVEPRWVDEGMISDVLYDASQRGGGGGGAPVHPDIPQHGSSEEEEVWLKTMHILQKYGAL